MATKNKFENIKKLAGEDNVNHPSHYNREDAMECIDEMVLIFGKEAVKNFCLCNAWKYRYRAADKNVMEDLKKSDWYLRKYKELDETITSSYTLTYPTVPAVPVKDWKIDDADWWNHQPTCTARAVDCKNNCNKDNCNINNNRDFQW